MGSAFHSSIFAQIGFEVMGYRCGAYHLQERNLDGSLRFDGVGLLFSSEPIAQAKTIEFFERNGLASGTGVWPDGHDIDGLLLHWGIMDARRIGESGLYSVSLHLGDVSPWPMKQDNQTVPRPAPEHDRLRHYAILGCVVFFFL